MKMNDVLWEIGMFWGLLYHLLKLIAHIYGTGEFFLQVWIRKGVASYCSHVKDVQNTMKAS